MPYENREMQHAALWLIGPDVPGLLKLGSQFVADRRGNIDKNIADKFGEKCVVFMSISAKPPDIAQMDKDKDMLKVATGSGVVFQPMSEPTVPAGFQDDLHGFDIITDDTRGLLAEVTKLLGSYKMLIVGHIGERRTTPGPRGEVQFGQKFVVMLPTEFDRLEFAGQLTTLVKKYNGTVKSPLQAVPGLLWWW